MAAQPAQPPRSVERLIDGAVALAVFAASVAFLAAGEDDAGRDVDALGVLLCAIASLPLAARRHAPLAVFLLTGAGSVALQAVADPGGPPLGPTLALYWLAAAGDGARPRTRLTLSLVAGMLVAHLTSVGLSSGAFPGEESLYGVVVWGGAWIAGDRVRLRQERMAELEERALRAEREAERERRLAAAEERTRIARDLHDSAGHAINVILVHAGLGRLRSETDPEGARETFETIEEVARETVGEIDELVHVLREEGAPAEEAGEVEPPPGLAALGALVALHRAAGLDVTATVRGERRPLPSGVERGAYRILQEALTNAARHGAGAAEVELSYGEGALELSVSNPVGDGAAGGNGGGHGVIGMRERAVHLGGSLETGARDGRFHLHAQLPLAT